jgi:biopolymer transport protein ExbD
MKDNFSEINVVPLVDIMLVLIVIVLITANFIAQGTVEVSLPQSDSRENVIQEAVRLEINAAGTIFYDKKELALEEIPLLLHGLSREQPVLISADKDLRLQPFITLLDEIKRLGFTQISVHTER